MIIGSRRDISRFWWPVLNTRSLTAGALQHFGPSPRNPEKVLEMFHKGDLQSGIALAVQQAKSVLCFVKGELPEPKMCLFTN
jgi:hypothetical protein